MRAGFGKFERHELRRLPTARGLAVTSTNPGFLDINLISPGNDFRRASVDAVLGELELAHASGSRHGDRDAGPPARTVPGSGRRLPLAARPGAGDPAGAGCGPGCDDRGEVDFERYARALGSIGFDGVTVYELIDLEPPMPRLHDDIATFRKLGWSLSATGQVPSIPKA